MIIRLINKINDKKEIKALERELALTEEECYSWSKKLDEVEMKLLKYQNYEFEKALQEIKEEDLFSFLVSELQHSIENNLEKLILDTKDLNYSYIGISCMCGFDWETYGKEIEEGIADLPGYEYDLYISFISEDNKVVYQQPVHCLGNGDGGLYNMFSCKRREVNLESVIYVANTIKVILEEIIDKEGFYVEILGMEKFREKLIYVKDED